MRSCCICARSCCKSTSSCWLSARACWRSARSVIALRSFAIVSTVRVSSANWLATLAMSASVVTFSDSMSTTLLTRIRHRQREFARSQLETRPPKLYAQLARLRRELEHLGIDGRSSWLRSYLTSEVVKRRAGSPSEDGVAVVCTSCGMPYEISRRRARETTRCRACLRRWPDESQLWFRACRTRRSTVCSPPSPPCADAYSTPKRPESASLGYAGRPPRVTRKPA
jgi:hypothetical protein